MYNSFSSCSVVQSISLDPTHLIHYKSGGARGRSETWTGLKDQLMYDCTNECTMPHINHCTIKGGTVEPV